jgi:mercuric ion binding protein
MKTIHILTLIAIMLLAATSLLMAQNKKIQEAEFRVDGVCDMCKTRIENAAYIKGVKLVEWNKESQKLKVVYNTEKTSLETIQQNVAIAGHSTEAFPADSLAYKNLPSCCAYNDGIEVH